ASCQNLKNVSSAVMFGGYGQSQRLIEYTFPESFQVMHPCRDKKQEMQVPLPIMTKTPKKTDYKF
ncbi:hypothetical protein, partial [Methylophaga lonarensis]|uniref:hypothetical protein n=1 Tax=Methylophaga lonarensis TaxID=999151 RepID=UPI003D2C6BC4